MTAMTEKPGMPRGGIAVHGVHRPNEVDGDTPGGHGIAWRVHLVRAVLLGVPILLALAIGQLVAPPTGLADVLSSFLLFAAAGNLALLGIVLRRLHEPLERAPRARPIGTASAALQRSWGRDEAPSRERAVATAPEASRSVTLSHRSAERKWRRRRPPIRDVTLERAVGPGRPITAASDPGRVPDGAERRRDELSGPRRGALPPSARPGDVVRMAPKARTPALPTVEDRRPPRRVVPRRAGGVAALAYRDAEHGPER